MPKNIKPPLRVVPNNSAFHLHAFVADKGGCGHIRIMFPFLLVNAFRSQKYNIQYFFSHNMKFILDGNFWKDKPVLIIQRPATENQLKIITAIKDQIFSKTKTKLIVEFDDDLVDVPKTNMAADYFNKNRENCLKIIKMADGVTVSTEHIAGKFRKYNKNIKVNPNHLCKFMWGDIPPISEISGRKPRILWAGSSNHFAIPGSPVSGGDMGEKLLEFIRKTTDIYDWYFMGASPNELADIKDKIHLFPWKNILEYPYAIKSLKADIGIAPLLDHDFNNSKSNIKALEYTACGMPGVYSNMKPYNDLTLACNTDEEIISNIELLAKDIDKRKQVWDNDYNTLKENLFWEENNNIKKFIDNILSFIDMRLPEDY